MRQRCPGGLGVRVEVLRLRLELLHELAEVALDHRIGDLTLEEVEREAGVPTRGACVDFRLDDVLALHAHEQVAILAGDKAAAQLADAQALTAHGAADFDGGPHQHSV